MRAFNLIQIKVAHADNKVIYQLSRNFTLGEKVHAPRNQECECWPNYREGLV